METCFALQHFALETKQLKSVIKVYEFVSVLAEKLDNDEEKIKVLANFDRGIIEKLYAEDQENSYPADLIDRIPEFNQNSFDFLRRIVNSVENNSMLNTKEFPDLMFGESSDTPIEYGYVSSAWNYTPRAKFKIPYYMVAKKALIKWNGLSEEEAEKTILESSFDEIESQVYAKQSMDSAIAKISEISHVNASAISKMVFQGHRDLKPASPYHTNAQISNQSITTDIKRSFDNSPNKQILDILSEVHNNWVRGNSKKFFSREEKHQHMPIELIGWNEARADLLFVQPILESMGIKVNEEELKKAYDTRVKEFFLDNDIKTKDDLANKISTGTQFYNALEGQEDILTSLSDVSFVTENILPQIEEKGIGSVESIRKDIVSDVLEYPYSTDMDKLREEEVLEIESKIDKENNGLEEEYRVLTEKERAIQRIKEKM